MDCQLGSVLLLVSTLLLGFLDPPVDWSVRDSNDTVVGYRTDSIRNGDSGSLDDVVVLQIVSDHFLSWSACLFYSYPSSVFRMNETRPVCFKTNPGNQMGPGE